MALTCEQSAAIADRQRVWEVRRFCQARYAHSQPAPGEDVDDLSRPSEQDGALSAMLRCLLHELDGDVAAISLLDEDTQHFISIVHRSTLHQPAIGAAEWYGCAQVDHRGGICEKTITMETTSGKHPVYEVLDLSTDETTKSLSIVDGTVAKFRHYAGVPISAPNGMKIGTVFVFSNQVKEEPLPPNQSRFMCDTARHVTLQLVQTLQALENQRSLRSNSAVSSMLNARVPGRTNNLAQTLEGITTPTSNTSLMTDIYQSAAKLLQQGFEFDGVLIQELPVFNAASKVHRPPKDKVLARHSSPNVQLPGPVKDHIAEQLLQEFPLGAVVHLLSDHEGGTFLASYQGSPSRGEIRLELCEQFPQAEQFLFMPLRDSFHDRDVAFILGYASKSPRVFSGNTDLPSLYSFSMAIMTQVRRLEAQILSRNKSDFLGSMSHEMRSPLHGILACIELLQQTDCTAHQVDLLESAEACGLQLRENIDNILLYSNIGSPTPNSEKPDHTNFEDHPDDTSGKDTMLALVQDTICRSDRKWKSTKPANGHESGLWKPDNRKSTNRSIDPTLHTIITVDASPRANFPLLRYSGIGVIINNLLVRILIFISRGILADFFRVTASNLHDRTGAFESVWTPTRTP